MANICQVWPDYISPIRCFVSLGVDPKILKVEISTFDEDYTSRFLPPSVAISLMIFF